MEKVKKSFMGISFQGATSYYLKYTLRAIISIALLGYLFYRYELIEIYKNVFRSGWYLILVILSILLLQQLCNTFIKGTMLNIFKFKMNFFSIFRVLFVGNLYGSVLPSMVGGDAYYIYFFGKTFKDIPRIASGIVLIKLIGLSVFLIIASIFILFRYDDFSTILTGTEIIISNKIYPYLLSAVILTGILFILRKFSNRIRKFLEGLRMIVLDIRGSFPSVISIIFLTIIFYFISIGGRTILATFIGIDLQVTLIAFLIILINLLILIPISISGIGVREMLYIYFFGKFGIGSEFALTLAVLDFSIAVSSWVIGGVLLIIQKTKN